MTLFHPRDLKEARHELGWAENERVVLFNAGDPICKRLDLARTSIQFAESLCGRIRFAILDGNVAPDLIPSMMNAADCLLLTSDWEGSPNVVKEALACNLPVVSVDVGDVRERLEGVQPSVIVCRDSSKIGKAISDILRQGQRSNGREHGSGLSSKVVSQRIILLYKTIQTDVEADWPIREAGTNRTSRGALSRE